MFLNYSRYLGHSSHMKCDLRLRQWEYGSKKKLRIVRNFSELSVNKDKYVKVVSSIEELTLSGMYLPIIDSRSCLVPMRANIQSKRANQLIYQL